MIDYLRELDKYNVIYNRLGKSDRSAMPLGNGKTGISLWVEENTGLQFYIGHTDAQSEVDRNIKLGKVFLKLDPNPFTRDAEFMQELVLREGCVKISVKNGENVLKIKVFVASDAQSIYIDIDSTTPFKATAELFSWRIGERVPFAIPNKENAPEEFIKESSDRVFDKDGGIVFYHKNETTCVKSIAIIEALSEYMDKIEDTLENRTFGGFLTLNDSIVNNDKYLISKEAKNKHTLKISTFCEQVAGTNEFLKRVITDHENMAEASEAAKTTAKFWDEYFSKSYIFVSGDKEITALVPEDISEVCLEPQDDIITPSKVTQSYLLTKYMFACCSKGNIPIYFNGMIFNLMPGLNKHLEYKDYCMAFAAQPEGQPTLEINPDEKGWEACINLWQNVRLPYAAMLERGEFEGVKLLFDYYRNFWDINRIKAKIYYNAEGQYNTEMTNSFGLMPMGVYGADRAGMPDGYAQNRWGGSIDISPGLELCFMMLDYYNYTRDEEFLKIELLPYAEDMLHFIETRFKERQDGKILIKKLNCVETYFDTTNPITVVAGMQGVIDRILLLSPELVYNRNFFEKYKAIIPIVPMEKDEGGNIILSPAKVYEKERMNVESPTLYPVYPFRMFTHYKENLKLIKDTFSHNETVSGCLRPHLHEYSPGAPSYGGWQYIGMVTALLGMTEDTKEILVNNCSFKNPGCRFPAMWGPVHDAVPDGDHGANITNTLQLMAMQSEGDKIYILPAWPKDWDVSFKLYAGNNTTVECIYLKGKIEKLEVTPKERMEDCDLSLMELTDMVRGDKNKI